jgi:hypothetical protein
MAVNNSFHGRTPMTHSNDKTGRLSRRRVLKATAAITAGLAAPTFLRMSSAFAAYPERPIKIVVAEHAGRPVRHLSAHDGGLDAAGDG